MSGSVLFLLLLVRVSIITWKIDEDHNQGPSDNTQGIREQLGLLPHTEVDFEVRDDVVIGIATIQIISAGLAARFTSGMNNAESLMIGFGMLGRAELAFVVMDIAYVQNQILTEHAFYTLMFTAFWLNIAVPLTIRWWKPYYLRAQEC